jgi:hypothetical protein
MSDLLSKLMRNFEDGFGYPPGENRLYRATLERGRSAAEALAALGAPAELINFYQEIDQLSMPDVKNGFFVHSCEDVVNGMKGEQPTRLTGYIDDKIVVFGSDGGGGLFALSSTNGQVYRLSGGASVGSIYEVDEAGVNIIKPTFWSYLNYLRNELSHFISPAWK